MVSDCAAKLQRLNVFHSLLSGGPALFYNTLFPFRGNGKRDSVGPIRKEKES